MVRDTQPAFSGGLNLSADESQVLPTEVREAVNARLTEHGGVVKRYGTKQMIAAALPAVVRGGITWRRDASEDVLVVANGALYTGSYGIPMTLTAAAGTLASAIAPWFTPFRNGAGECVFIADGGLLNSWDGATLVQNIAGTPAAIVTEMYNQRLFAIIGTDENLHYSALNNGATCGIVASGGGTVIVRTFGDQRLTGLATVGGSLLIFHRSGISRFTGYTQDDINIAAGSQGVTSEVGTTSPHSLVKIDGAVLFYGSNGFYTVTESSVPQAISQKIDPLLRGLTATEIAGIRGIHARRSQEVRWFVPGIGVLVYNYRLSAWSGPWTQGYLSPVTTCLFESVDTEGKEVVLAGDAGGFVSHTDLEDQYLDGTTSAGTGGTAVQLQVRFHRLFAGDMADEKSLRWGYLLGNPRGSQDVVVRFATPFETNDVALPNLGGGSWGSGTWGVGSWGGSNVITFRIPMWGRGIWCDVWVIDTGTVGAGLYSRFELEAFSMTRRG